MCPLQNLKQLCSLLSYTDAQQNVFLTTIPERRFDGTEFYKNSWKWLESSLDLGTENCFAPTEHFSMECKFMSMGVYAV
jgi:hypothetical protein